MQLPFPEQESLPKFLSLEYPSTAFTIQSMLTVLVSLSKGLSTDIFRIAYTLHTKQQQLSRA